MKWHPGRHDLMAYAEGLADRRGILSAKVAGHVSACPVCMAEVQRIRASFELLRRSGELEPSDDFTTRVLLAAREKRTAIESQRVNRSRIRPLAKGMAYAAGVLLVAMAVFKAALNAAPHTPSRYAAASAPVEEALLSPDAILRASTEVQALAAAVQAVSTQRLSPSEIERRRTVQALNTDIEAARAALQRNPGCLRASRMMDDNLQRQAQALRALYLQSSL